MKPPLPSGKVKIIDDYGHHPYEIESSIKTVRTAYSGRRLVLIFEPHRYTRTRDLWDAFVNVLAKAPDALLLLPVYAAHEPPIQGMNHYNLAKAIRKKHGMSILVTPETLSQTLLKTLVKDDIVLFQGAGNIGKLAKEFQEKWNHFEENLPHQSP